MTSITAEAVVVESTTADIEIIAVFAAEAVVAPGALAVLSSNLPFSEALVAIPIEARFEVVT